MSSFAKNLKRLMETHRVSATQLCKATNVPKSSVSEWLAGREPRLTPSLVRVARYFGTSIDYLITGETPEDHVIKNSISNLDEQLITVHQGVYKLTLEKQIFPVKKEEIE